MSVVDNCSAASYGVTDVFDRYPDWLLYFAAFCFVVFITVGIPGNLVTIVALGRSRKVHSATVAFIVNLSVADLLFCTFNLPLAVSNFVNRGWVHGQLLCVLSPFLRYGNIAVVLMSVMAITLNRFVTIVHPSAYQDFFRPTTNAFMVAGIWLVSFVPLVPTLAGVWGRFGFDRRVGTCTILAVDGTSPKVFLFVVAFVVPCLIICLCYVRIYVAVRRQRSKVQPSRRRSSDLRLVKMILVIFGSFVLCNLPLTFVKVLHKEEEMPLLNTLGYVALYATSCTNPLVYVAMSREYRRAYLELFACCVRKPRETTTRPLTVD